MTEKEKKETKSEEIKKTKREIEIENLIAGGFTQQQSETLAGNYKKRTWCNSPKFIAPVSFIAGAVAITVWNLVMDDTVDIPMPADGVL